MLWCSLWSCTARALQDIQSVHEWVSHCVRGARTDLLDTLPAPRINANAREKEHTRLCGLGVHHGTLSSPVPHMQNGQNSTHSTGLGERQHGRGWEMRGSGQVWGRWSLAVMLEQNDVMVVR